MKPGPCAPFHLQAYAHAVTPPAMAYDPNYTPDNDEFQRATANKFVSTGAIVLGSIIVIAVSAVAIAHYGYDMPIYRRTRGTVRIPAKPSGIIFALLMLGVGGTLALCAGLYLRRRP